MAIELSAILTNCIIQSVFVYLCPILLLSASLNISSLLNVKFKMQMNCQWCCRYSIIFLSMMLRQIELLTFVIIIDLLYKDIKYTINC